jgi:hypothetical protein
LSGMARELIYKDWRNHGKEILPILRAKYPQAHFQGIVSLARVIRWDVDPRGGQASRRCRQRARLTRLTHVAATRNPRGIIPGPTETVSRLS